MINKVTLIGHLGGDAEIKYTGEGVAIANLNVATSESWKDKKTGEKKQSTEWHRVIVFGKLAEAIKDYLKKGAKVYVEGRLRTRKWTDKEGVDRWTTEIVISGFGATIKLLDKKDAEQSNPTTTTGGGSAPAEQQVVDNDGVPGEDDIPL